MATMCSPKCTLNGSLFLRNKLIERIAELPSMDHPLYLNQGRVCHDSFFYCMLTIKYIAPIVGHIPSTSDDSFIVGVNWLTTVNQTLISECRKDLSQDNPDVAIDRVVLQYYGEVGNNECMCIRMDLELCLGLRRYNKLVNIAIGYLFIKENRLIYRGRLYNPLIYLFPYGTTR